MQFSGKGETNFNLRLNNRRKDTGKADAILGLRRFAIKDYILNRDGSFIIIKELRKSSLSRDIKKELLK